MSDNTKEKYLKFALVVVGILFFLVYPIGIVWPSGWTGTVGALDQAISRLLGVKPPVDREREGKLYERLLREQYKDPDLILENAGMWTAKRIAA